MLDKETLAKVYGYTQGENGSEISVKFHPNFSDIAKYQ